MKPIEEYKQGYVQGYKQALNKTTNHHSNKSMMFVKGLRQG